MIHEVNILKFCVCMCVWGGGFPHAVGLAKIIVFYYYYYLERKFFGNQERFFQLEIGPMGRTDGDNMCICLF